MFTGLVEETGPCVSLTEQQNGGWRLVIAMSRILEDLEMGASVAVNGCCLTVAGRPAPAEIAFDLLGETLARTNLGELKPGRRVNLERSLRADGRLGGHFVQGHVDAAARVLDFSPHGADYRLEIELPPALAPYVVWKGPIAVDGISLTVAEVHASSLVCWIIPHTRAETNLAERQAGDLVNLETDLLAKYVERLLVGRR